MCSLQMKLVSLVVAIIAAFTPTAMAKYNTTNGTSTSTVSSPTTSAASTSTCTITTLPAFFHILGSGMDMYYVNHEGDNTLYSQVVSGDLSIFCSSNVTNQLSYDFYATIYDIVTYSAFVPTEGGAIVFFDDAPGEGWESMTAVWSEVECALVLYAVGLGEIYECIGGLGLYANDQGSGCVSVELGVEEVGAF